MKYVVSFFLFGFLTSSLCGVAQPKGANIDSLLEWSFELRVSSRDSSLQLAQEALVKSKAIGDFIGEGAAQVMIGAFFRQQRPDTAIVLFQSAIELLKEDRTNKFLGLAYWYMGKVFSSLSAYDKAREHYREALGIFQLQNNAYFMAAVISDFGVLEGKQFNYVKALEYTNRAYSIKKDNNLPTDSELNNLAIIYSAMRDYAGARKILWQLLSSQKQLDTASMYYTFSALGGTYADENAIDSAVFYFRLANLHAEWNNNAESKLIALANLAGVYVRSGKQAEADQALKEALRLRSNTNTYLNQIIEVELARLFFSGGKMDSAIRHAQMGLSMAKATRSKKYASEMAKIISDAYSGRKRIDSAFFYYKIHSQYKDSLSSDEGNRRFNDLRVQLETSEKEKELVVLRKESELDRARFELFVVVVVSIFIFVALLFLLVWYRANARRKRIEAEKLFLKSELDQREMDLSNLTLQMIHRQNAAHEIEAEIRKLVEHENETKFQRVLGLIGLARSLDREWETFNSYFNSIHQEFYTKLLQINDQLSISEQRLCALIKMRLPNREIANLLNIEVGSVKMAKYRLKKKLKLDEGTDLDGFIARV